RPLGTPIGSLKRNGAHDTVAVDYCCPHLVVEPATLDCHSTAQRTLKGVVIRESSAPGLREDRGREENDDSDQHTSEKLRCHRRLLLIRCSEGCSPAHPLPG